MKNSNRVLQSVSFIVGLALIVFTAYQAANDGPNIWPLLFAGIAAILAARLEDLVKFKISKEGLEAELRSVLEEAKVSLDQLQHLAATQARITLQQIASSGRLGGGGSKRRDYELAAEVVTALKALNVKEADIKAAAQVERPYIIFDYVNWILAAVPEAQLEKDVGAWTQFYSHTRDRAFHDQASPDELESFIRAHHLETAEVKERILDYRHYLASGTHRRLDVWLDADGA